MTTTYVVTCYRHIMKYFSVGTAYRTETFFIATDTYIKLSKISKTTVYV